MLLCHTPTYTGTKLGIPVFTEMLRQPRWYYLLFQVLAVQVKNPSQCPSLLRDASSLAVLVLYW